MGFEYDASTLKKAESLIAEQKKQKDGVKTQLSKVKDGYFSGKEVVLKSGLSKADVEKILAAQTKVNALLPQIEALEKSFKSVLSKAYTDQKSALDKQLAALKTEYEAEVGKFPKGSLYGVVGHGPEKDLKDALKEMK